MDDDDKGRPCMLWARGDGGCRAYLGIPIGAADAERSCVLSTLIETGGGAELPQGITVKDFIAWSTTSVQDAESMPPADLARAMQVRTPCTLSHIDMPTCFITPENVRDG